MSTCKFFGSNELSAEIRRLENVPDYVFTDMLKAMGETTADLERKAALEKGIFDPESRTKHLVDVIKVGKPKLKNDGGSVNVNFSGNRKRGKSKTPYSTIAHVNEFGKRGQKARPFVYPTLRKYADKINDAASAVLSKWFYSQN